MNITFFYHNKNYRQWSQNINGYYMIRNCDAFGVNMVFVNVKTPAEPVRPDGHTTAGVLKLYSLFSRYFRFIKAMRGSKMLLKNSVFIRCAKK